MKNTHLLAPVLKITHKRLLDSIELGKLHVDGLPRALKILSTLSEILASLNSGGGNSECPLQRRR